MATELADLHIPVGICGVDVGGIVYRMDNVPIQFRKVIDLPDGVFDDETLLQKIADRIEEIKQESAES
jgi:formylmethanofuran dehydrogenase subunit B